MKSNAANQVEAYTQNSSKVSLSLHTLIDVRHDVMRHQGTAYSARSDFPGQRTGKRRGQGLEFVVSRRARIHHYSGGRLKTADVYRE